MKLVPWLAADGPVYDPATLSYTVKIKPCKWSDGSELTSADVAFTGNIIKTFKVPRFLANWEFIKNIETPDKHTVRFFLREPRAIFLSRTLTTPIVQKKRWEPIAANLKNLQQPLSALLNEKVTDPVSSGPFVLKEWKRGSSLLLEKNDHFFGRGKEISGYLLGPYIDGVMYKFFGTTDAAVLALLTGNVDMFWWGLQQGYLQDLEADKNIKVFTNEKSALYYVGFNVRKKPFDDIYFRKAIALLTDKRFIIQKRSYRDMPREQTPSSRPVMCSGIIQTSPNMVRCFQERTGFERPMGYSAKAGTRGSAHPLPFQERWSRGKKSVCPTAAP